MATARIGKMIVNMFPQSYIDLQRELSNHPRLCELLCNHPPQEFELRIAEIATYCDVVLDGQYTPDDMDGLCDLLTKKLRQKTSGIILLN